MKKKIHIKLASEDKIDIVVDAIKTDNKIKYKDNNISVVITILEDEIHMKRKSDDYTISLIFKLGDTISNYQVFGGSKTFDLETHTKKLIIDDDKILIDYNLGGNDFSFELEVIG